MSTSAPDQQTEERDGIHADTPNENTPQELPEGQTRAAGDNIQEMEASDEGKSEDTGSVYDLEPSDDSAFRMGTEESIDPAVMKQLSNAFVDQFLPSLEQSKSSINEVLSNQTVLIETVEQENSKFRDCTAFKELTDTMAKAKEYHNKLLVLKRDMVSLHDRAGKLKKRALKLQQQKQREELQRAHQQEKELEKEQMLTARVARPDT
ncbi:hypothetical protein BaRGS_00027318 [Batillaria attramentaria]|uniref:Biogenesis of lysosome-related organelles complex 1 subunit 6 n=1 Tax=Batillaria attramentaria TaxID=370345 RepID=A0ABD0K2Y9_9CAEN